jgi:hypothetical protein
MMEGAVAGVVGGAALAVGGENTQFGVMII